MALRELATPEQIRRASMHGTNSAFQRYFRTDIRKLKAVYERAKGAYPVPLFCQDFRKRFLLLEDENPLKNLNLYILGLAHEPIEFFHFHDRRGGEGDAGQFVQLDRGGQGVFYVWEVQGQDQVVFSEDSVHGDDLTAVPFDNVHGSIRPL